MWCGRRHLHVARRKHELSCDDGFRTSPAADRRDEENSDDRIAAPGLVAPIGQRV
jgi:hypothetical protein